MIENFDDFCLWMYVMVDDLWQQIARLFKRPGPEDALEQGLDMITVSDVRGWFAHAGFCL